MTSDEADEVQNWLGMDGANAWHLIDRHAANWHEIGELMNAWLRSNVLAERDACANGCDEAAKNLEGCPRSEKNDAAISALKHRASVIRMRTNVKVDGDDV